MKANATSFFTSIGFRAAASTALLSLCLLLIDFTQLIDALSNIAPEYFIAAFLLNTTGTVLVKAWIAYLTTHSSGLLLSFLELVRINLIARFYTLALPRGASAAIRWHHYRKGGSGHAAAALLLFENIISILTLFLSAALILIAEYEHTDSLAHALLPLTWIGVLIFALLLLPFLHRPSAGLFRQLLQPILRRNGKVSELAGKLIDAISNYQGISCSKICWIIFASLSGYLFFILGAWVLAQGMDLGVSLAAIAWIRSITLLVALTPITIAGIGLREGTLIALLSGYGIPPSPAFAYAIASFAIQLALGVFGAILEAHRVLSIRNKIDHIDPKANSQ